MPSQTSHLRRVGAALRPLMFLALGGGVALAGGNWHTPTSALQQYQIRALVVVIAVATAAVWLWADRREAEWGFEVVPAATGAVAAMVLVGSLRDTPFGPEGLGGDQTFRTAAVTRFADTLYTADYTIDGLPAFYPPAYFWVLGRLAAVADVDAYKMIKLGTVLTALGVPMLAFVLWRRLVTARRAALISLVPIVVENFYEPYSWIVIVAIIPWWLEVVHGVRRPDVAPGHPIVLGSIGAVLFMTYCYFFAIGAIAIVLHLGVERKLNGVAWGGMRSRLRRPAVIMGIAAALSAVYWLPLAISLLEVDQPESLGNRWFNAGHVGLRLPMLELDVVGAVALAGLLYLLWVAPTNPLARGLLVFLAATYVWYVVGALAAVLDRPLLTFRSQPLVPMILLSGGVLAMANLAETAAQQFDRSAVRRVATALAVTLGVYAGQGFVSEIGDSSRIEAARSAPRPWAAPPEPSADELQLMIEDRFDRNPVLLSDRVDVLALFPNHGFVPWNAHYAHPASQFRRRTKFLDELAALDDPAVFADQVVDNDFGPIDGFVLQVQDDELVFHYVDDAFPNGNIVREIRFARSLFAEFDLTPIGDHMLITRP